MSFKKIIVKLYNVAYSIGTFHQVHIEEYISTNHSYPICNRKIRF